MFHEGLKKMLARILLTAFAVLLYSGAARAAEDTAPDEAAQAKKHAAELGKGKTHQEAEEAARPADKSTKAAKQAKRHAAELNKGKTHQEAEEAARTADDDTKAGQRAKKHAAELNKGKTHQEAEEAAQGK